MPAGFVKFADGTASPAIAKGEWRFTVKPFFSVQEPGISEDDATFNYYGPFYDKDETSVGTYSYFYDGTWFNRAVPFYNHNLTRMSMRMALAGFGDKTGTDGNGKSSASKNIWELMEDLGFEHIMAHYPQPKRNTIGYIIGAKNVRADDGTEYSLINVTIRSGGYGAEWGGNFQVGTGDEHEGWTIAKEEVIRGIEEYMEQYGSWLFPTQKVWIQGYSRGGAVANLVAKELDNGTVKGVTAVTDTIFAFCFEVPQGTRADDNSREKYYNIINIVNPVDLVPKVVPSKLGGYGRYGRTLYFPYTPGTKNYSNLHDEMYAQMVKIAKTVGRLDKASIFSTPQWGMVVALDNFMDNLPRAFFSSPTVYEKSAQDALITFAERFLGNGSLSVEELRRGLLAIPLLGLHYEFPINTVVFDAAFAYIVSTWPLNTHWPELCMAWLDSLEGEWDYGNPVYRRVFVNCPVDVTVIDSEGNSVGEIVDGEVIEQENSSIYVYIDQNDQMVITLPTDEEYRIEMKATDDGTVTYTATEYNMDTANTKRVVSYYKVDVEQGDLLTGIVENMDVETPEYPLALNDKDLESTLDQSGDEISEYTVTVTAQGNGSAGGGGIYVGGEFAKVAAEPDNAETFLGWYIGGTLISDELEYRFLVDKDYDIVARFTTITNQNSGNNGGNSGGSSSSSGSSSYTITVSKAPHGTVTVTPKYADFGARVTFTATPDDGYIVGSIAVKDSSGKSVDVTDNGDGTYTFTMPRGKVTVSAAFVPVEEQPPAEGPTETPWTNPFSDVAEGDWFYEYVAYVEQNSLMDGVGGGRFDPSATTTRGMIMTILARLDGVDTSGSSPWWQAGMEWAVETGVSDGTNTEGEITREQLATMLWRYAKYKGYDVSIGEDTNILSYNDVFDISEWAIAALQWAVGSGVIEGTTESTLSPLGKATRAEAATMLTRFCQNIVM